LTVVWLERVGMLAFGVRSISCLALVALASRASVVAQTIRVNGPLAQPGAGDVVAYAFTPSGARMVFRADLDVDGVFELYSAPSNAGSPPLRLAPGVPA